MSTKREQPSCKNNGDTKCHDAAVALAEAKAHCQHCDMNPVCHAPSLNTEELDSLDQWFPTRRRLKRGEAIFDTGTPFSAIYAVRSGFFKTLLPSEQQRDQITGFQMTGEILGLDGIGSGFHACRAVALESSEVCMMPYGSMDELANNLPTLHAHLNKLMSQRIVQDQSAFTLLANLRSESRLAAFLVDLGKRFAALGYSPHAFVLRMTREEIGSYLGLSLETVSRLFSRFQEDGLVDVQTRHLRITDPETLTLIASGQHPH
jgi:CRP/FNR family transcriptional regulator, anaerobic regulatory protein